MLSVVMGACKTIGKLGVMAPELLRKRRKALRSFRSELYAQGVDREAVEALTATYKELGDIKNWR